MSDSATLRKLATFLDSRPVDERNSGVPYYEVVLRAASSLEHVAELVKAARAKLDAEPYASGTPYDPRAEAATRALEAALKPFEGP